MDSRLDDRTRVRKYPGVTNYQGLLFECAFYAIGSVTMSYKTYTYMKTNKNPMFSSILGLTFLWMLNLKTDMMADLLIHMKDYPELYPPNGVPQVKTNEDNQE